MLKFKQKFTMILKLILLIFLYISIFYAVWALKNPKTSDIIDIEVYHDGKEDRSLALLSEENGKKNVLLNSILLKGKTKDTIQFKKDDNHPVKLFLITEKDSALIFDNTKEVKENE